MLTHFSLFTGIGGADLAAEWAGFETVGQVEWADYPTKVLEKHWPNVPRWRDIHDVTGESVKRAINDRRITVISGGFPCQPFSVAGKRKGKEDDRFLWPEMLRVISELKPTWVVGENVANFVNMALEETCIDLENEGYEVQPFIIPACGVEAFQKRDRCFIVANIDSKLRKAYDYEATMGNKQVEKVQNKWSKFFVESSGNNSFKFREEDEPWICGNDDGIRNKLDEDRLKCLGNSIIPVQIYPIFESIAQIELEAKP